MSLSKNCTNKVLKRQKIATQKDGYFYVQFCLFFTHSLFLAFEFSYSENTRKEKKIRRHNSWFLKIRLM